MLSFHRHESLGCPRSFLAAVLRSPDADAIRRSNVEGTRNLIAAASEHSPEARVVMASTSLVYTDDLPWPAREADDVDPTAAYPASKVVPSRNSCPAACHRSFFGSASCTAMEIHTSITRSAYSMPGGGTPLMPFT